ncbi:MAG: putative Fe-S cluster assembly protein SufT [Pseudomonadales bacterium]
MERNVVVTTRDCPARLVPVGTPITINKDTFVTITQSLGGNYTVTVNGNMARVDGTDADALGLQVTDLQFDAPADDKIVEDQVWIALKTIYDPEIPVDIVNLGLVYTVAIDQAAKSVAISMTLTAPGCGMGPVLASDVEYRVGLVPNVEHVSVDLVFDPPWSRDRMSEEAQLETGMFY